MEVGKLKSLLLFFFLGIFNLQSYHGPRVSFGVSVARLTCCVFAGGSSHRNGSETANTGHVSFLQQAQEQVLVPVGSGHYLKEKDKSPPHHQPGL